MANSEEREKTFENSSGRKPRPNYRPPHIARGRGRHDPHIAKAMYNFGVSDLRELLNRKHIETQSKQGPPPDPSYNFLKDPLRDNKTEVNYCLGKSHEDRSGDQSVLSRVRSKSTEGRSDFQKPIARSKSTERKIRTSKRTFIHNPKNIKVELSTSTGERSCKIDGDTTLANIRHVPDHDFADQNLHNRSRGGATPNFRGSWRGRNISQRGRGRQMKENSSENNEPNQADNNETVKGRGHFRGRRSNTRGRSQRGNRGRGQNSMRGHKLSGTSENKITNEDTWDDECVDPVPVEDLNLNLISKTNEDAAHDEVENDDNSQKESESEDKEIKNEHNIVITYPIEEVNAKRSVRFDVPETEVGEQEIKESELPKVEDNDDRKNVSQKVTENETNE